MNWVQIGAISCAVFWLAGCGSIAKGITEAVLEQNVEVYCRPLHSPQGVRSRRAPTIMLATTW